MRLFNRIINTEIFFEKCIGLAVGYTRYKKSSGVRCTVYSLIIPFMVIEVGVRYNPPNKLVSKKKRLTFTAKSVLSIIALSCLATILSLHEMSNAISQSDANAMAMMSAVFTMIFVVLSICYLNMDPKEKYYG